MQTILVVDDQPMNHEVIHACLEGGEYALLDANSGEEALAIAKVTPPDLVLLDVMMPGLNGFETAKRLKEQARGEYLPIILVTALDDPTSRLLGLRTNADEFLTKPVDRHELIIRVRNLLTLRSQKMALLRQNAEQIELHRFKDELSSMIVHDLKNPMAAVLANLGYVLSEPGGLNKSQLDSLQDAQSASQRVIRLIHNLLDVTRIEGKRLELRRTSANLESLVAPLLQQRVSLARSRGIEISSTLDPALALDIDSDLISRVIENVLDNALRYTPSGGRIQVFAGAVGSNIEIRIANTGVAIPPDSRRLIFEKFGQSSAEAGRMNLGLGLYFCRLAVEAHGGRIWVDETSAFPTVFNLELPVVPDPVAELAA